MRSFAIILASALPLLAAAFDFPEFVPMHKRQAPGTPQYECHEDCGGVITLSRSEGFCENQEFQDHFDDCMQCALKYDIWQYYGNSVSRAARECGLDPTPVPAEEEPEPTPTPTPTPPPTQETTTDSPPPPAEETTDSPQPPAETTIQTTPVGSESVPVETETPSSAPEETAVETTGVPSSVSPSGHSTEIVTSGVHSAYPTGGSSAPVVPSESFVTSTAVYTHPANTTDSVPTPTPSEFDGAGVRAEPAAMGLFAMIAMLAYAM
ncbi:hypothetical protein M501DRAFT_994837 [Patellaria atrata CBS 101060]|uniref:Uncharacterized protein n=1 Tax=Patellaria atrata CBS 101060 TaxID=1346257 RepID=A0A9P4SJF7_9PEZI|nr:hypothetical protein M501DRAFT_994837 [Patellaria atrata CBS 101060]